MTDKVMEKWKKKLRNMKKEDYIVLLLLGVLLLILSLPTEKKGAGREEKGTQGGEVGQEGDSDALFSGLGEEKITPDTNNDAIMVGNFNNNSSYDLDTYVGNLEKRVEEIISGMEGVGKVQVMITLSDMGTEVLEWDREITTSTLEETDSAGGNRKSAESGQREEVILRRDGEGNEAPYVVRRRLPEVTGVVVIAEGAGNAKVKENIIGAVGVLFNLNEHRIKVIRMKS